MGERPGKRPAERQTRQRLNRCRTEPPVPRFDQTDRSSVPTCQNQAAAQSGSQGFTAQSAARSVLDGREHGGKIKQKGLSKPKRTFWLLHVRSRLRNNTGHVHVPN
jgi:hypothetical protein